jgi:hypothetical protein
VLRTEARLSPDDGAERLSSTRSIVARPKLMGRYIRISSGPATSSYTLQRLYQRTKKAINGSDKNGTSNLYPVHLKLVSIFVAAYVRPQEVINHECQRSGASVEE